MTETVQQYIQRILNALGSADPLQVLAETPSKLEQILARFTREQLKKGPAPDKWSAAQIVMHLSEAEIVIGFRARLVIGSNGIGIQAFDQDAWAARYGNVDVELALNAFRAMRNANLAFYRGLSDEQWQYYGMHSERGKETVRRIVEMCAGHDINHLRQLEAMSQSSDR